MKTLHKIKPYSDEDLIWNEKTKQYELTLEYFKANYDENFVDDEETKKRLHENSKLVYRFIKIRTCSYNRRIVNNVINFTQEGREFIKEMLSTQMEADVDSGYNDLSKQPAINLANGRDIDRALLSANEVSVPTEEIWDSSDDYFGFRLGYQAPFPAIYFVMFK